MPRPRRPGAPEPKRRSRKGCWPCKARKVKCGEEKPVCLNCRRQNEQCDYSIRLNWGGRTKRSLSVDSPSSQSSAQSAQFFFALSPADAQLDSNDAIPLVDPLNVADGNSVQDQDMDNLLWGPELVQETTAETSFPRGLHGIQESPVVHEQSSRAPHRTDDKTPVELSSSSPGKNVAASWQAMCQAPLSNEIIPGHQSSFAPSMDAEPYTSPADTGPSIGSLAILNWSPATVSQPISFLRQSADIPEPSICQSPVDRDKHRLANRCDGHTRDFPNADVTDSSPSYSNQSSSNLEFLSPHSRKQDCLPPSTSTQRDSTLPANTPASTEDLFATTMDAPPYTPHSRVSQGSNAPSGSTSSERKWHIYLTSVTDNYGLDCGRPDLDLNQNDDHSAIDINYALSLVNPQNESPSDTSVSGSSEKDAQPACLKCTSYAYYELPVPINIPRYLSPLPVTLVQTPVNLMYFHHFLNHTARMLVPHDCGNNPFITVLPSMAIGDSNLLNLMLAYSASHRARYLKHPEPANRIAHWVSNVFPALRLALEDAHKKTTDNHLAAAIMLLSLKIVSPSTFEVPIPWQSHLKLARDLFLARKEQMVYPGNRVGAFLTRWLGYIDIMGTLSCRHSEPPLLAYFSSLNTCCTGEKYDEYCVDCFTGFTPRTGLFLMRLGQLVHQCDNEQFDGVGTFVSEWTPSADTIFEAQALLADLEVLNMHAHANGRHFKDSMSTDIVAMDQAFRYAGLVHLQRRVLGISSSSPALKRALDKLFESLAQIRSGSSAEVGAVFPLFTAGCESQGIEQRTEIQSRFELLESTGLKQIQNARTLMQRCWKEDRPWITLTQGEFLG